jgi:cupin superfamily acireductone dioxygenase involved in methionine salvage
MDKQIKATEERFEDIQKHLAIKQKNTLAFQESDESDQYETLVKKFLYAHKSTNSLYQEFVEQDSAKLGEICDELLKDNI